jgi:DNA-binding NarL/FixJ family response regulator
MASSDAHSDLPLTGELVSVAEAAGERLRAQTEDEADAAQAASARLLEAATAAMSAGYSLTEIANAEARGKAELRNGLRPDALRRVERTGRQARDAQAEHHRAILRATRLGLSTREIAHAAQVAHGTVRAISNRLGALQAEPPSSEVEGADAGGEG